jgi:hypothetical protein
LTSAVLIPALGLGFIITERTGLWDRWLGLTEVEKIAVRFETSYAENVDRQVGPDEPGWQPVMRLIRRYSGVVIPAHQDPRALVRYQAILSGKVDLGSGHIAEWTAPSTPIAIIFKEPGLPIKNGDVLPVGTIADLRGWANRCRADLKFLISDVLLGLTTIGLGFLLWFSDLTKSSLVGPSRST